MEEVEEVVEGQVEEEECEKGNDKLEYQPGSKGHRRQGCVGISIDAGQRWRLGGALRPLCAPDQRYTLCLLLG